MYDNTILIVTLIHFFPPEEIFYIPKHVPHSVFLIEAKTYLSWIDYLGENVNQTKHSVQSN